MDETALLSCLFRQRKDFESLMAIGMEATDFSEAGKFVVTAIGEQYKRDEKITEASLEILRSQAVRRFGQGSMADSIIEFAATFPDDISGINILEEYRLLRLARLSTTLATLLATGQHGDETLSLVDKYKLLCSGEQGEVFKPRLEIEDFEEDDSIRIQISPKSLNDYIGGGVSRGHNITVYGRPDSGKSLFAINQAAYACKQGYRVLYVGNEEPSVDITRRLISRLAGVDIKLLRDRDCLLAALEKVHKDYQNWFLYHKAGVTAKDISRQCATLRPDFLIVDQLKNVATSADNRALQLDTLARQVRELGIEHECVTLSVTQAGESAHNKLVLTMTDVEWSNTGIPGAADLMVGIGVDDEYLATNKRMISIPKNKVNGRHGAFPTWIEPERTAFLSKQRNRGNK